MPEWPRSVARTYVKSMPREQCPSSNRVAAAQRKKRVWTRNTVTQEGAGVLPCRTVAKAFRSSAARGLGRVRRGTGRAPGPEGQNPRTRRRRETRGRKAAQKDAKRRRRPERKPGRRRRQKAG